MLLVNNKPPCKPTPLVITVREAISLKIQYNNIIITTLLNRIDISRLLLTALDNKVDVIDKISIIVFRLIYRVYKLYSLGEESNFRIRRMRSVF